MLPTSSDISDLWARRRETVLQWAVGIMSVLAALKLGDEFRRLVFDTGYTGAIDLRIFRDWVVAWFAGNQVYGKLDCGYPPASMPILWLGFGSLNETATRWVWAGAFMVGLWALGRLMLRESFAESKLEKAFVLLMPLSMNATGVTVGNGQLSVHVLWLLLASIPFLNRTPEWNFKTPLAVAGLLVSLVKPTFAAPFFGVVLVARNGIRLSTLVGLGYVALTMFAARFQDRPFLALLNDSLAYGHVIAGTGGYANLHNWLLTAGLSEWSFMASFLSVGALWIWLFVNRRADVWVLLGVTAIVARLWTYHRVYDDMLVLPSMLALFRIAKHPRTRPETSVRAGLLLAAAVGAMLAPARLELLPFPWHLPFTAGHPLVWLSILMFLIVRARSEATLEPLEEKAATD